MFISLIIIYDSKIISYYILKEDLLKYNTYFSLSSNSHVTT